MNGKIYFVRLNFSERAQHMIFVICFFVLALTGFMVKIPEDLLAFLGSYGDPVFFYRGIIHRVAATLMILISIYHVCYLFFSRTGRLMLIDMIPKPKDAVDMYENFKYYLGSKDAPPEFDRFTYKQKLEYLALIAGNTLMSVSGLLLWSEYIWDKFILDIAALVHGMEAILACLAIVVWHLYEVHLRPHKFPIDNLWITGLIDEEEMKEEYPLHYKRIMEDPELQAIFIRIKHDKIQLNQPTSMVDLPRIN